MNIRHMACIHLGSVSCPSVLRTLLPIGERVHRLLGGLDTSSSPPSASAAWACREFYGDRRRGRVDRHHPPRPRARRDPARHRRHVRPRSRTSSWSARPSPAAATRCVLATKFGNVRGPDGALGWYQRHARSTSSRPATAALRRLGVDHIDLYYQHRVDPNVPIEETVGAMAELVDGRQGPLPRAVGGRCRHHPPGARGASDHGAAERVLAVDARSRGRDPARRCASWASGSCPTARSGAASSPAAHRASGRPATTTDFRAPATRASPGEKLQAEPRARRRGPRDRRRRRARPPAQLALAWLLAQGDDVVPIPGTKRVSYLEENVAAAGLRLDRDDLAPLRPRPRPRRSRVTGMPT